MNDFDLLKKNTSILPTCAGCLNHFKPIINYQLYCSEKCESIKRDLLKKTNFDKFNKKCIDCGLNFRKKHESSPQRICDACTHSKKRAELYKFIENKPKKDKKEVKPHYRSIIQVKIENKRLLNEKGRNHYNKNRKWDFI